MRLTNDAPMILVQAEWIAPLDRKGTGAFRGHGLAIREGRIIAIDDPAALARKYPLAAIEDLGAAIILPGLVNAHTHLELSDCHPGDLPEGGFSSWLLQLVQRSGAAPPRLAAMVEAAIAEGVKQSLACGVTTVGDISRECAATRSILRGGPLRVTSYGEIQALAQRRGFFDERFAIASSRTYETEYLRIGLTPHAPYTVEPAGYRACLAAAAESAATGHPSCGKPGRSRVSRPSHRAVSPALGSDRAVG